MEYCFVGQIDPEKIIEYPGFTVNPPEGVQDVSIAMLAVHCTVFIAKPILIMVYCCGYITNFQFLPTL
jgi:hypothetical protein